MPRDTGTRHHCSRRSQRSQGNTQGNWPQDSPTSSPVRMRPPSHRGREQRHRRPEVRSSDRTQTTRVGPHTTAVWPWAHPVHAYANPSSVLRNPAPAARAGRDLVPRMRAEENAAVDADLKTPEQRVPESHPLRGRIETFPSRPAHGRSFARNRLAFPSQATSATLTGLMRVEGVWGLVRRREGWEAPS